VSRVAPVLVVNAEFLTRALASRPVMVGGRLIFAASFHCHAPPLFWPGWGVALEAAPPVGIAREALVIYRPISFASGALVHSIKIILRSVEDVGVN
jgi:hypothetical protein